MRVSVRAIILKSLSVALVLLLITVLSGTTDAQTRKPASRVDTQLWDNLQIAVPISKEVDFILSGTLHVGRNLTEPVDERIGIGLSLKAGKYITFAPNYMWINTQPTRDRNDREERSTFPISLLLPIGHLTLIDRNQFERRIRHPQGDSTRYRNRLQLERSVKVGTIKLRLFASDEVFYDWSVNEWVRNRFSVGASTRLNRYLTSDLYYLRQNDGRSIPGDLHVLGAMLRVSL